MDFSTFGKTYPGVADFTTNKDRDGIQIQYDRTEAVVQLSGSCIEGDVLVYVAATATAPLTAAKMGLPVETMMEVQNMAARMQNIPVLVNGGMSFEEAVREGLRAAAMNVPAAREAIVQGLVASTVQKEQQQISEIQQRNDRKTRAAAATSSSSGGVQELPIDVRTMAPDARMNAMADAVRAFQQG